MRSNYDDEKKKSLLCSPEFVSPKTFSSKYKKKSCVFVTKCLAIHVHGRAAFNIIILFLYFGTKRHYNVCICKLYTHNLSCMLEWLYIKHDEKCHMRMV